MKKARGGIGRGDYEPYPEASRNLKVTVENHIGLGCHWGILTSNTEIPKCQVALMLSQKCLYLRQHQYLRGPQIEVTLAVKVCNLLTGRHLLRYGKGHLGPGEGEQFDFRPPGETQAVAGRVLREV